jgi:hypothetical protein
MAVSFPVAKGPEARWMRWVALQLPFSRPAGLYVRPSDKLYLYYTSLLFVLNRQQGSKTSPGVQGLAAMKIALSGAG